MEPITILPVGIVRSQVVEPVDENWGNVLSTIQLSEEYSGGLNGLDRFSHAIIVTYLHLAGFNRKRHLKKRPRELMSMPEIGIFSQRAKDRPNPIGITAVRIMKIRNDSLDVMGLDAINGTPVLDIKPYYPQFDRIDKPEVPDWVNELMIKYF